MRPLPRPERRSGCPPDELLEHLLLSQEAASTEGRSRIDGRPRIEALAHLEDCAHCAQRLEWMRSVDRHFIGSVFPRTREALVERALQPRSLFGALRQALHALQPPQASQGRRLLLPSMALAVAAALVLVVTWRSSPEPDYLGVKGRSEASDQGLFEVYLGVDGIGRRLVEGDVVHPGDGLRFVAQSAGRTGARLAFVFSIDSQGTLSRLYPLEGDAPGPALGLLPGGAILDDVPGPERIFAVFPDRPMRFQELEAAARQALAGLGSQGVRTVERLPLDALDAQQHSLLLEKRLQ